MLTLHIISVGLFVVGAILSLLLRSSTFANTIANSSAVAAGATVGSGMWLILTTPSSLSTLCKNGAALIAAVLLAAAIRREYADA